MARHFTLTADGGSRGNPGPAGYGSVITENGKIIAELYDFIGIATNNVAEYAGLIAGLTAIHEIDPSATIDVKMDSKLVVEQMSGRWQIKHADMRVMAQDARAAHNPSQVSYTWIPRDENSHADRLANKALSAIWWRRSCLPPAKLFNRALAYNRESNDDISYSTWRNSPDSL